MRPLSLKLKSILIGGCWLLSSPVLALELSLPLPQQPTAAMNAEAVTPLYLASSATPSLRVGQDTRRTGVPPLSDRPWVTANRVHQYLGLASIALATLTVLSPKEENGPHEYFAKGAAALGGAAIASGFIVHSDDISLSNGWGDPDNQHALLTTIGTLGYLLAVSQAPDSTHAGAGMTGFVAMALGIRLTW